MNIGRIKTTNHNFAAIVKRFLNETGMMLFMQHFDKAFIYAGSPKRKQIGGGKN